MIGMPHHLVRGGRDEAYRAGRCYPATQTDEGSLIWVGWFDEGVFGNESWHVPGLERSPSSYGLVAFDDRGSPVRVVEGAPTGGEIADCYALNVAGQTAWACTYVDFPISRSQGRSAISPWLVNHARGTQGARGQLPLCSCSGRLWRKGQSGRTRKTQFDRIQRLHDWRLPFSLGARTVEFVDARGDQLHVVKDGVWNVWALGQFLSEVAISRLQSVAHALEFVKPGCRPHPISWRRSAARKARPPPKPAVDLLRASVPVSPARSRAGPAGLSLRDAKRP